MPTLSKNNKRKTKKIFSVILIFLFFGVILFGNDPLKINTALASGTWFNDGSGTTWSNRFLITPASVNSDLYYDLSLAPASFWSNVRSDGGDICVTKQDGTTQLPREVSGFDYAGHKGSLFIGTGGGTAFYIYYGNPAATEPAPDSAYGKHSVWESAAKLEAHLEDMATPALDATSNLNNLSASGTVTFNQTAKLLKGVNFGGGSLSSSGSLLTANIYTVSMWIKPSSIGGDAPWFCFSRGAGATAWDAIGTYLGQWVVFNGSNMWLGGAPVAGNWYHLVYMRNGTNVQLYVNNVKVVDNTLAIQYAVGNIIFGIRPDGNWPYTGPADDIRVFDNRALSPTEIATMYANQNAPASFWTTGGVQTLITAIGATTGTPTVGSVLTAGSLTPSGATGNVTYQWQKSSTSGGTYSNISSATSSTYTVSGSDAGYYIEVQVTGTGNYTGTVESGYVGPVTIPVTSITVTGAGAAVSVLNGGTLQMSAAVLPANATNQTVTWSVTNGTGSATINSISGLLTATGAGTVTVTASATDGSGITGTEVITVAVAPSAPTLVLPASGSYTNNTTPTLSAGYYDPTTGDTGKTNYRIDSSSSSDCIASSPGSVVASGSSVTTSSNSQNTTWTPSSSIGSDGTYYWCAQNKDSNNFTSSWTALGSFTLDSTSPTSTISSPSDNSYSSSTTVALSGTSSGTNLSNTTISVDSGSFVATGGTAGSWTYSATGLSQGAHTFQTKATNAVGSTGLSSVINATVDTTPPSGGNITYTTGYYTMASVSIAYNIGSDPGSGLNDSSGEIQRATATLSNGSCGTFGSFTNLHRGYNDSPYTDSSATSGNCYEYQYIISNNAGLQATYASSNIAKVDTTLPVTTANPSGTYNFGTWTNASVNVTLSCADSVSGCSYITYCYDQSNDCTPNNAYSVPVPFSSNGTWYIRYYSTDAAGMQESVKSEELEINTTPPTTSDNFTNSGVWLSGDPTIVLYPANNNISGLAWTRYCEDTANICDPSQGIDYSNAPVLIAPVSTPSTSYFRYASADNAGNIQTTVSLTVMIDTSPQVTQILINPVNVSSPPTASSSVTITNEGHFNYEYEYAWCVVTSSSIPCNLGGVYINGADSRDIFYGSNAKNINAGDDFITTLSATVPTAGTYYFEVVTYYDNNQHSSAFQQFTIGSSTPTPTYTLTYAAGTGGTISGTSPQTVNSDSSGTAVTAVANTGYTFLNWSDGVTTASRTDTDVIQNIQVTANFAIDTYTLTYSAGGGGTISGATTQTVNYSSSGSAVTAVPSSGYNFTSWSDGLTQNPRTDTNVNQNITIAANFTANQSSASGGGGGGWGGVVPIVTVTYDAAAALANNPDFNTDMNLPAAPPFTAWCVSGSLIKGSGSAVYYCGNDGKRYVFVNDKAYFSWYPDFSTVQTISDETLAQISIGGNVTYRPGVRLVKSQSDTKVYAIARGGVLRWIMTEGIAARLFGANWNQQIDDISDAFFVNYKIGAPITQ